MVEGTHAEDHQTVIEDCDIIYARMRFGGGTLMGSRDFANGSGTYPDGTKNTGQHMIYRNIRVTDPRPEYALFGYDVSDKGDAFGVAGIRLENMEFRHPVVGNPKCYFLGTALGPIHHMYFDGVSFEGKKLDATLINDPTLFHPLVNTSNFIFRDAPQRINPPPAPGITWSSAPYTVSGGWGQYLNTGKSAKDGTLLRAENVGGGALTFDGIDFSAGTITLDGTYNGFHGNESELSRSGAYASGVRTVTLNSLTAGSTYRVQVLVYDGRGQYNGRRMNFDGVDQGQYAHGMTNVTWGNGLLVTGVFTADATGSQSFTIGSATTGAQLNALLVHELPTGTPVVSNPAVTSITGTSATINADLTVSSANVNLYWDTVDQGVGAWSNTSPLGNQPVGPVGGNLTDLTPDTRYFYRFYAVNTAASTFSWSAAGTSFVTVPSGKAPLNPAAAATGATTINLTWTDHFNTETGFIIERSPSGAGTWTQVGTTTANSQIFLDSGLVAVTSYDYRVTAQNGSGLSDESIVVSATTRAMSAGIQVEAWFRMGDDGQGANKRPLDSSGNGRNFVNDYNGGSATLSSTGGGYGNDAYYSFPGVYQGGPGFHGIGYDPQEDNVGIEVWVRRPTLGQDGRHIFGTGSENNGIDVGSTSTGWFGSIAGVMNVGTVTATANEWTHLAVVRASGVTTFYVNGVASGTSNAIPNNATSPRLAMHDDAQAYFSGDVAEARIFTFDPGQFNANDLLYSNDPYDAWANDYPLLTNPALSLDLDNGGLPTGIEWVTGGDPSDGGDDASVTPTFNNSDPDHFIFTFRRLDAAAADAGTTIVVEYGSDLAGWRNTADHGAADGVTVDDTTDLGGGFHQVTVSIPRSLAPSGKLFARLKVTRP